MLGLGRALGETIVVYAIISPAFGLTTRPLQSGTNTIASHIASRYSESSGVALSGLLGAGLVLFLFTLVINTARRCGGQPIALRRRARRSDDQRPRPAGRRRPGRPSPAATSPSYAGRGGGSASAAPTPSWSPTSSAPSPAPSA